MHLQRHPFSLSVVVIGRNEGRNLVRCLQSVRSMHFARPYELIYVDSGSTDGSPAAAAELGAKVIIVNPRRPAAAVGRNAGWHAASAPLILFLDGDTILHPDFVAQSVREFQDPNVAVVWGHRREIRPEGSVYNRVLDLDWIYSPGVSEFCGGDAIIRRSVLDEVGGYNENLIAGEEPEMCRRMRSGGYMILHVNLPMTGHDLAITSWPQYWRRSFRTGYAYAEVSTILQEQGISFWRPEVKRNLKRGVALLGLLGVALLGSMVLYSLLPLAGAACITAGLVIRTALKSRWKSPSLSTCLLYGIHSHLQQIPILFGQLSYRRDRRAGRRRKLIEYKESSAWRN
jgi:cellulose synthase/poly-beta-1,6-N-acetylglucosamine synthase-like glycosyltransferase